LTRGVRRAIEARRGLATNLLLALPCVITLLILRGIAGRVRPPEALGRRDSDTTNVLKTHTSHSRVTDRVPGCRGARRDLHSTRP